MLIVACRPEPAGPVDPGVPVAAAEPTPVTTAKPKPAPAPAEPVPAPAESTSAPDRPVGEAAGDGRAARVRYIVAMHRKIHETWAWGFLERLDELEKTHPLNDYDLWTRVEVVLAADGAVAKVTTVRASGKPAFDQGAVEVVRVAGPFGPPPASMRSPDGRAYLHWALHRDERACGTFGATPFVLESEGKGRPNPDPAVIPRRP